MCSVESLPHLGSSWAEQSVCVSRSGGSDNSGGQNIIQEGGPQLFFQLCPKSHVCSWPNHVPSFCLSFYLSFGELRTALPLQSLLKAFPERCWLSLLLLILLDHHYRPALGLNGKSEPTLPDVITTL